MVRIFLIIFFCIIPGFLSSEDVDSGFGTLATDRSEAISFSSDSLFFNEKTGYSEMKGSVKFSQGTTVLLSNYAEISFNLATNELEQVYASGDVVLKSGDDVAMGNEAVYNFTKSELTFLGDVFFSKAGSTVKAQKAVINTDTGFASMTGNVQTTFMPRKQKGVGE